MIVKEIIGVMNGYDCAQITKQGTSDVLFVGRVDEYLNYPFNKKIDGLTVDHIAPCAGSNDTTIMIICKG